MELNDWMAQIRKGTLDMLVLSVLRDGEKYGLELINLLKEAYGIELAEGTLYPLLNRLRTDGAVIAKWDHNAGTGHPRKYYSLTKQGRELVAGMHKHWRDYASTIDTVISERGAKGSRANAKQA
jgi:PadR family transcriptional regulator, regulatory protein PadR